MGGAAAALPTSLGPRSLRNLCCTIPRAEAPRRIRSAPLPKRPSPAIPKHSHGTPPVPRPSALLPKTLVAEVREAAERRREDESCLRALSLASRYDAVTEVAIGSGGVGDLTFDCSQRCGWERACSCSKAKRRRPT